MNDITTEFDEWFNSLDGYGLVSEYFYEDFPHMTPEIAINWLRSAFDAGVKEGFNQMAAIQMSDRT